MNRRSFIGTLAAGLLAAPLPAVAHPTGQRPKIGYLASGGPPRHSTDTFLERLRELGYESDRNLDFEFRSPAEATNAEQLRALASAFVSLGVDVLVAVGPPAAEAARRATHPTRIPVVMVAVDDPVGRGLVTSLARPGGNVTGVTWDVDISIYAVKTLRIVTQVLPKASRVAFLWNVDNPVAPAHVKAYQTAATAMRLTLLSVGVSRPEQFEGAFTQLAAQGAEAVIVDTGHMSRLDRQRVTQLATSIQLPTICGWRKWIVAGCLLSYGPIPEDMFRRAADYVDQLLRGAQAADLPIEVPTKLELAINLKTARALGLTIPATLLQRADRVME